MYMYIHFYRKCTFTRQLFGRYVHMYIFAIFAYDSNNRLVTEKYALNRI